MRILALDSSGLVASVAVVRADGSEEELIAEYTVNYKKRIPRRFFLCWTKWSG